MYSWRPGRVVAKVVRRWLPVCAAAFVLFGACVGDGSRDGDSAHNERASGPEPLSGGAEAAQSVPGERLPDLEPMPIRELYIEGEGDARVLRFSTTVFNRGDGPLELVGSYSSAANTFIAAQHTYQRDGSMREREVGQFQSRGEHAHWHFEVWTRDENGDLADRVLTTGKTTFCAVDEVPELESAPPPAYLTCGEGVQGISAGWSDTYAAVIPGQELELRSLPDGDYALRTVIDPGERLYETDKSNNALVEYVRIDGSSIEPVQDRD